MKNSTKYLLAALLVLLASLTAYNMALRAEYRQGTYKDPMRGYLSLGFKDFTEVSVPAASSVGVRVEAGPYRVRMSPRVAAFVHVRQQGGQLVVTADFPARQEFLGWGEAVVITCPRLTALRADAVYTEGGQPVADKGESGGHKVLVTGFKQDSLLVQADRGSHVELASNHLAYLRAVTGTTPGSHPNLQLNADNQSQLTVHNLAIATLHYQVADSAQVMLTGAALASLPR
jgi:hypothetical protein